MSEANQQRGFFREYLEEGMSGADVGVLGIIVQITGCAPPEFENNLEYGPKLVEGVCKLQGRINNRYRKQGKATRIDKDGKCGPDTQKGLADTYGVDVRTIPAVVVPASKGHELEAGEA